MIKQKILPVRHKIFGKTSMVCAGEREMLSTIQSLFKGVSKIKYTVTNMVNSSIRNSLDKR